MELGLQDVSSPGAGESSQVRTAVLPHTWHCQIVPVLGTTAHVAPAHDNDWKIAGVYRWISCSMDMTILALPKDSTAFPNLSGLSLVKQMTDEE